MSLPPSEIPQGAIRFNTDSQRLEFYAQGEWWVMSSDTPNLATAGDPTPGARGVWGGGYNSGGTDFNVLDYVNISSTGNAIDFGDMIDAANNTKGSCASSIRGLWAGGNDEPGTNSNRIEYITFASTGNSIDFGDLTVARRGVGGVSSATRGVFGGGRTPANNTTMDYVTIASTGNAVDFGDLLTPGASQYPDTCASPTRGIFKAGSPATIDFITIASLGNTSDTGADLTSNRTALASMSSKTRAVFAGGYSPSSPYPETNIIDYQHFISNGNFVDFGDLTTDFRNTAGLSNGHGGLG